MIWLTIVYRDRSRSTPRLIEHSEIDHWIDFCQRHRYGIELALAIWCSESGDIS